MTEPAPAPSARREELLDLAYAYVTRNGPGGPWDGFAQQTVTDWLAELARAQPAPRRRSAAGTADRTLALAFLRGCLLDLLATGDRRRTGAALERHLAALGRVES